MSSHRAKRLLLHEEKPAPRELLAFARKTKTPGFAIFDFDDTLYATDTTEPIVPMVQVAQALQKNGHSVYIITARPGYTENRRWVLAWLRKAGITIASKDMLMMAANGRRVTMDEVKEFKAAGRLALAEKHGKPAIFTAGDQNWDLSTKSAFNNTHYSILNNLTPKVDGARKGIKMPSKR
jgi:hypothetical protein